MRTLDIYIAKTILIYTLIAFAVLLGLFTFVNFIDQLADLGVGSYGIKDVIYYVALTIPRSIYDLFPMMALLGAILGLSVLEQDSELIVMRASGISVYQIAFSVLKVGFALAIIALLIGEFVAPKTETMAQKTRTDAMQKQIKQQTNTGLWVRDSRAFVNISEVLPDLSLLKIKVIEFDSDNRLRSLVYSEGAKYSSGNTWNLEGVKQTLFDTNQIAESRDVNLAQWTSLLTPEILSVYLIKPDQLSARHLQQYISHLAFNNQDTRTYELAFWTKVMLPISTALMMFIAIPFVFHNVRSAGIGRSLFIGIMLGIVFYVINRGFGYFVLVYGIPPFLGAVIPIFIFMLVGLLLLRRIS